MFKIIRLSRFKFDKEIIQHNVTMSVSGLFDDEAKMVEARINIMTTLLESVFPVTITIASIVRNAHPLTDYEKSLTALGIYKRDAIYNEGDEITLDQLKNIMLFCYAEGAEAELNVLDIKNQHVTVVINKDVFKYHYLYGTPETFTPEYLATIKKKLKDCVFDGSFKRTL